MIPCAMGTCISSEIYERDVLVKREQEEREKDRETERERRETERESRQRERKTERQRERTTSILERILAVEITNLEIFLLLQ
jgi:hypothetical protein